MLSLRKLRANLLNARKSTGPKTEEGKAKSARNALRHGVFSRNVLLPGEDEAIFDALKQEFIDSLRPQDVFQLSLVERIAGAQWRLNRLDAAEHFEYTHPTCSPRRMARDQIEATPAAQCWDLLTEDDRLLERIELLRTRLQGSISRAMRELQQLQDRARSGHVPQENPYSTIAAQNAPACELEIEATEDEAEESEQSQEAERPAAHHDAPPCAIATDTTENAQNEATDFAPTGTVAASEAYAGHEDAPPLACAFAEGTKRDMSD